MICDRDQLPLIQQFIEHLVRRCEMMAGQAGIGAVETVGHVISYLVDHPKDIEPFLVGGFGELPDRWWTRGDLTYHDLNGHVRHPQDVRFAGVIEALKRGEVQS